MTTPGSRFSAISFWQASVSRARRAVDMPTLSGVAGVNRRGGGLGALGQGLRGKEPQAGPRKASVAPNKAREMRRDM
jgi:hypothetical protein